MASSQPPPNAKPLTAAITGLGDSSIMLKISWPFSEKRRPITSFNSAISAMSAPAAKAFSPSPVKMIPFTSSLSKASCMAEPISSTVSMFRAFNFETRLTVMVKIPSSRLSFRLLYSVMDESCLSSWLRGANIIKS
jgi:hypothetical protein